MDGIQKFRVMGKSRPTAPFSVQFRANPVVRSDLRANVCKPIFFATRTLSGSPSRTGSNTQVTEARTMKASRNRVGEAIRKTQGEVLALLRQGGLSYEGIARQVRCSARTVYNIAKQNGLRRRETSDGMKGGN
jgi:DNA-binding CsgD family transcriptional regulator